MRRFFILLRTEFLAWRGDPLPALGGFIPCLVLLTAFWLLFGGRLAFRVAALNHDEGPLGQILVETLAEIPSPLNGKPYYDLVDVSEEQAWRDFEDGRLSAVWVIPEDFSERLEAGAEPAIHMHFGNLNDDQAKNHRLYQAEVRWRFYERIGLPAPPLALAEEYPLPEMVPWFPIIGVGVMLLGTMLGGMINIFLLTHREQLAGITLEFALAPRSLLWVFLPKTVLALGAALATGSALTAVLALWTGYLPTLIYVPPALLLMALVALFWIALALLVGLWSREYFTGMIGLMLTGITLFFLGGGLALVRANWDDVVLLAKLFPNVYVVDLLRDLILFGVWPADWASGIGAASLLAVLALAVSWQLAARRLRRWG